MKNRRTSTVTASSCRSECDTANSRLRSARTGRYCPHLIGPAGHFLGRYTRKRTKEPASAVARLAVICRALDRRAYEGGIRLRFIGLASPCRPRASRASTAGCATSASTCTGFAAWPTAGRSSKAWRLDYNWARPHSALGGLTPEEYRSGLPATSMRKTKDGILPVMSPSQTQTVGV